jgi:protein-S-isoprenylcysteine O-methyltransferase Ste14
MEKPTTLESFRRMGASYTIKQKPPRLPGVILRMVLLWLAVLFSLYPLFGQEIFTRPALIIWACVMAPGTILAFVMIAIRWRRNGPPD